MKTLAKELFLIDMEQIDNNRKVMKVCDETITHATTLGFYSEFMSEDGGFLWDKFRKMVNKAVEDKVEAATTAGMAAA